ncbi:UDP-N-acetylglucosamine 1-carboxyvinyltransferase [Candidatus Sumerlaeota bacterium]|nr:UDP-N-acetylglucosamine 1-carboxyvinyltransferase [Candidatus Sumerlaeota bacterium]
MEKIMIEGGLPLKGSVKISGSKNAALPLMAASVLVDGPVRLSNVPQLSDIRTMADLLRNLGALCEWVTDDSLVIDGSGLSGFEAPYDTVRKMRASIYVLGPLLARLGRARVSAPGGCAIGPRPIDLHLRGLEAIGTEIALEHGYIEASAGPGKLQGRELDLIGPNGASVGATCNVMMAALGAQGTTVIRGAAREPEVADLCNFINAMGGAVEGAGTDTLAIEGGRKLGGGKYSVIPDRIEAATFLVAGAITQGDVTAEGCRADMMQAVLDALSEIGFELEVSKDRVRLNCSGGPLKPVNIVTMPYPDFPTDVQAQLTALLTLVPGVSTVKETIYVDRFIHIAELLRLGADITLGRGEITINGVESLSGAPVMASDLRASAALVLAGLAAQGTTDVLRVYHIDRGYERIDNKLRSLGARIRRGPQDQ